MNKTKGFLFRWFSKIYPMQLKFSFIGLLSTYWSLMMVPTSYSIVGGNFLLYPLPNIIVWSQRVAFSSLPPLQAPYSAYRTWKVRVERKTQISDTMERLKDNSDIPGMIPITCPLLTLGDPLNIFPFFGSHSKTWKFCRCKIIVIFVLIPTTIPPPNLAHLRIIHITLYLSLVLFLVGHHRVSNRKCMQIFVQNQWTQFWK